MKKENLLAQKFLTKLQFLSPNLKRNLPMTLEFLQKAAFDYNIFLEEINQRPMGNN
jgi:hypothetical protein